MDRKRRFDIFTNLSHKQRLVILYGKYPEQDIRSIEKFIINLIYVRNEFWKNLDFSKLSEGSNHVPLTLSDRNMEYFIPIQELNNKIMFAEIDVPESYFKHGVFAFDLVNTLSVINLSLLKSRDRHLVREDWFFIKVGLPRWCVHRIVIWPSSRIETIGWYCRTYNKKRVQNNTYKSAHQNIIVVLESKLPITWGSIGSPHELFPEGQDQDKQLPH